VEADRDGGEDRGAIAVGIAIERLANMLQAGAQANAVPWEQRHLRRPASEAFQCVEPMIRCQLADNIHPCMEVEWRDACAAVTDFSDAKRYLVPDK
jgi:hypothetical protein